MRRANLLLRSALLVLLLGTATSVRAAFAPLRLEGWPLTTREAESLLAPALRAPTDASARASAALRATTRLQAGGWLDARVTVAPPIADGPLLVTVDPGTRYRWRSFAADVPPADTATLSRLMRWPTGAPADPTALGRALGDVLARAEQEGHAWAQLSLTTWDADSGHVDVRVGGALGPRVRITGTRIEGLAVTRPGVATRALGVTPGMTYHPGAARAAAARLSQLGVFTGAEFTGIEGGPRWEEGVLAFRVREPRYNRFEGAVGLQGEAGVAGLAVLELGNLLGTARAAELAWQSRGRGLSDLRMRYREPFVLGLPVSADLGLLQELQDSTYTRTRWGVRIGHTLGSGDRVEAGLEEERVVRTRGTAVTVGSTNTVFAYERDGRDDRLAPRRGTRVRLSGTGVAKRSRANTAGAVESRSRAGVAAAIVEWNRPLGPSTGLSWEVRGDGRFAAEGVLEDHERTPVGGANTLRGQDEAAFRADRVVLSRLEWRAFPGSAGERVALFWDHARMWTRVDLGEGVTRPETRDVDGVGLGLRLRAAGGWVDVDYGLEPGRGFLEGRVHLRLVSTF